MTAGVRSRSWLALAMLLLCAPAAHAAPFTFALLPASGEISGEPGSTIGWGYVLANPSETEWLMATGLDAPDPFENAEPDAFLFDFPILAPLETRSVPYNGLLFEGLYQLTWDLLAPIGFTNTGVFTLSAEFWDGDPFDGGSFLSFADDQTVTYVATVAGPVASVPEPGTLLLMGCGVALALVRRRRRTFTATASDRPPSS